MNNLLFLDTETTGKDENARLLQLCYKLPGDLPPTTCNFKPPVPITFEAMATHHITEAMVANAMSFEEAPIKTGLQALLDNNVLVAHNAPFDIEILRREGVETKKFIDTLKIAQFLFDEPSYKLQYLRYRFNLNIEARAHDAEGDVLVLEALFNFLCNAFAETDPGNFEGCLDKMIDISLKPTLLRRIGFGKHKGTDFKELPRDYMQWLRKQSELDADLIFTLDHYLKI